MRLRDLIHLQTNDGAGGGRLPMRDAPDPNGGSDEPITDPASGTGLDLGQGPPATPAAAQNTDTGGSPPAAIPYSRFKEVNDARRELEEAHRPYADLRQQGYEPDDLHRLVQWELEFTQNPAEAWLATAASIMDQLPDTVQQAIQEARGAAPPTGAPTTGTPAPAAQTDGDPPDWFKPYAEDIKAREQREREAEVARTQADAQAAASGLLDRMIEGWTELDKRDNISSLDTTKLTHIIAASQGEDDPVRCLTTARENWLAERENVLSGAIRPSGSGSPRPVPNGGSGGATPQHDVPRARTVGEASKRAMAAIQAGGVPDMMED